MPPKVRIAMLNADTPVPNVLSAWDTYGNMFHDLLVAAASRIAPDVEIQSINYDTQRLEYPRSLDEIDVILVTGSASSSYDDKVWIKRLDQFLIDVYTHHPRIKIFGSCFGHQLVCECLLRDYGVRVEKDPKGWELGVKEIKLNETFRKRLGKSAKSFLKTDRNTETPENLRVQFVHADHVMIPSPDALPSSWVAVGTTSHCAVQGVYEPGRVFTLQGHFEFNRFVNTEIMKVFGATWEPQLLQETFEAIDADDDAEVAAEMVLQFLLEKEELAGSGAHQVLGGLLTPPLAE
ncbi:class I glutamine amidotransferase-like protein [Lentithecium fluviatile CBS 122367]|uniref:Class I glutamine amidotransferase-like protein n=1 Tax=Lentithecium fluviatile CBS 122367 TaxID=1168545 RepID=A0A6G1J8L8_9PLEO|nr:class I glutamine amidotransferase-like protein [Lentithecium fluviatile CBS 122367]